MEHLAYNEIRDPVLKARSAKISSFWVMWRWQGCKQALHQTNKSNVLLHLNGFTDWFSAPQISRNTLHLFSMAKKDPWEVQTSYICVSNCPDHNLDKSPLLQSRGGKNGPNKIFPCQINLICLQVGEAQEIKVLLFSTASFLNFIHHPDRAPDLQKLFKSTSNSKKRRTWK